MRSYGDYRLNWLSHCLGVGEIYASGGIVENCREKRDYGIYVGANSRVMRDCRCVFYS